MSKNSKYIDEFYRNIALNDRLREDENLDNLENLEYKIALSLGYTLEDIESGANLGLGCGNPIENANLKSGEIVLDLGCGKGMDVFKASKIVGENGLVIGVDRLFEMVEKAEYISKKKDILNTKFVVSDIDDLQIEDNSVDCVISNCVINLCDDKKKVYKEIFRVLKPGGRISISDIVQYNKLPDFIKNEPIFHATWVAGSLTLEKLRNILSEVGFNPYTVIEEDLTKEYLAKWGHKFDLENYIKRGKILAFKPK